MTLTTKILLGALALVLLLIGMQIGLRGYTDPTSIGGFSESTEPIMVDMNKVALSVPQNLIRLKDQRAPGYKDRLDLFVEWPSLSGYKKDKAETFLRETGLEDLIFISIETGPPVSVPKRKLEEIYQRFFVKKPWRGPNGLIGQALDPNSGYQNEDVFYARAGDTLFLTRCLQEAAAKANKVLPTCLYEFEFDENINVYLRFHRKLLADWQDIDVRIKRLLASMRSK